MTGDEVIARIIARQSIPGKVCFVQGSFSISERFNALRENYRHYQRLVDAGLASWDLGDVYSIADWGSIFSPIESAIWADIRYYGLAMWPQFPVGRYFVDFGNPVAKVAIECDGKAWHQDKQRDARRQEEIEELGWEVHRIPGWMCKANILSRYGAQEEFGIEPDEYEHWLETKTPFCVLRAVEERISRHTRLKHHLELA